MVQGKNERGERLRQFCEQNNVTIANTLFKQPIRQIYTWKSPGDIVRNQIDLIMINQTFRNGIKQAKTYSGADINSDHNPVRVKMEIKLKRTNKATPKKDQLEMNILKAKYT